MVGMQNALEELAKTVPAAKNASQNSLSIIDFSTIWKRAVS